MVARLLLGNAPLIEAIIDFRVKLSPDVTIDTLKEIADDLPSEYSDIELRNQIITELKIEKDDDLSVRTSKANPIGYWCKSSNGLSIAQIRLDGFTFSALKPYSKWEDFSDNARNIWELYYAGTKCDAIARLAVRYINHLEIPWVKGEDLSKYLVVEPKIPDALPQIVSNFLSRVTIVMPVDDISAHVTQALIPPETPGQQKIILDIDVFKEPVENIAIGDVWDTFSVLRNFKNDIFFEYITKEALEIFK